MAGEVIVDALPYIDQGYDEPGVREAASAMVEEECRRFRPTKNYLEHLPPLNVTAFETAMMHTEFERLQNRLPMDTMSMKRYELPPPPSGKLNEEKAWFECVENSQAQLEHQAVRILNLQLMLEFCCPAWQRYLQTLSDCEKIASKNVAVLRQALQEVNWQRKSLQTKGGEQLRSLEAKWVALVSHNYEIEQACCLAEEYIANMSNQLKNYRKQQEEYQRKQEECLRQQETERDERVSQVDDLTNKRDKSEENEKVVDESKEEENEGVDGVNEGVGGINERVERVNEGVERANEGEMES